MFTLDVRREPAFAVLRRVSEPCVSDYGSRLERQAVAAIDDHVMQRNNLRCSQRSSNGVSDEIGLK